MFSSILLLVIALTCCQLTCFAQESNVRVINQSANGLAYPSSSYIGPGTLSKTAQEGAGYRPQNGPPLPKVNHGGYFGTPGDNLYGGKPDLSRPAQINVAPRQMQPTYRQVPKAKENSYIPDPNIPMTYENYKSESTNLQEQASPNKSENIPKDSLITK